MCPILASFVAEEEEPQIILPDISSEIVKAFLSYIYEGFIVCSSSNMASQVEDLMICFGLQSPPRDWFIQNIPQAGVEDLYPEQEEGDEGLRIDEKNGSEKTNEDEISPGNFEATAEQMEAGRGLLLQEKSEITFDD